MVSVKDMWVEFGNRFSKTIFHPQFYLKRYENVAIELISKWAGGILIDIGCGRQPYRNVLEPLVSRYIGVDHPQIHGRYGGDREPDILADAAKIPLKNATCDTVVMISVLEHLPDPKSALREAYRLCKPGGRIGLITVQNYVLHDVPYDFYRFTQYGLKVLLEETGWEDIEILPLGNFWELIGQYTNVGMWYSLKEGVEKGGLMMMSSFVLAPIVLGLSIAINLLVWLLGGLNSDKLGKFAIYNFALGRKSHK